MFRLRKGIELHKTNVSSKKQLKRDCLYQVILEAAPEEEDNKSQPDDDSSNDQEMQNIECKYDISSSKPHDHKHSTSPRGPGLRERYCGAHTTTA